MDGLLQADVGIEEFSSYINLRVQSVKHKLPLNRLFGDARLALEPIEHGPEQRAAG